MSIQTTLKADIITAMKARETERLATLRLLSAAIKQREVDTQAELDEAQVLAIVEKACKQRRESISQYAAAGRSDLVAQEEAELVILQTYLPAQMSADEVQAAVTQAIAATGASSMADMGRVMASLKTELAGRADMAAVSQAIKAQLTAP